MFTGVNIPCDRVIRVGAGKRMLTLKQIKF